MKLYVHPFSQHARRVRIVCEELRLRPELESVALEKGEHMSASFTALNPAHAVPVCDDEGFVLAESHAIMRYLCEKHSGDRLYPRHLQERALVEQWLDWTHCKLNPPVQALAIHTLMLGAKGDSKIIHDSRQQAAQALQVLEAGLTAARGMGEETIRLSDIAAGTSVALYLACQGDLAGTPRVASWYQRLEQLPSFIATRLQ